MASENEVAGRGEGCCYMLGKQAPRASMVCFHLSRPGIQCQARCFGFILLLHVPAQQLPAQCRQCPWCAVAQKLISWMAQLPAGLQSVSCVMCICRWLSSWQEIAAAEHEPTGKELSIGHRHPHGASSTEAGFMNMARLRWESLFDESQPGHLVAVSLCV